MKVEIVRKPAPIEKIVIEFNEQEAQKLVNMLNGWASYGKEVMYLHEDTQREHCILAKEIVDKLTSWR